VLEWRVTYRIEPTVSIDPAVPQIPQFHLELYYTPERQLEPAVHTLTIPSNEAREAVEISRLDLLTYWEALRYTTRVPLVAKLVFAISDEGNQLTQLYRQMKPEPPSTRAPDATRLASAPPGLATWLRLANAAARESDDASALRSYYVILERIHNGRPKGDLADVGYVRDREPRQD
jgi:hypothetical protein